MQKYLDDIAAERIGEPVVASVPATRRGRYAMTIGRAITSQIGGVFKDAALDNLISTGGIVSELAKSTIEEATEAGVDYLKEKANFGRLNQAVRKIELPQWWILLAVGRTRCCLVEIRQGFFRNSLGEDLLLFHKDALEHLGKVGGLSLATIGFDLRLIDGTQLELETTRLFAKRLDETIEETGYAI